jgi:hypothetical protein
MALKKKVAPAAPPTETEQPVTEQPAAAAAPEQPADQSPPATATAPPVDKMAAVRAARKAAGGTPKPKSKKPILCSCHGIPVADCLKTPDLPGTEKSKACATKDCKNIVGKYSTSPFCLDCQSEKNKGKSNGKPAPKAAAASTSP